MTAPRVDRRRRTPISEACFDAKDRFEAWLAEPPRVLAMSRKTLVILAHENGITDRDIADGILDHPSGEPVRFAGLPILEDADVKPGLVEARG